MDSRINRVVTGPAGAPVVVLLHSAGLDLTYWEPQIAALRDVYRVLALDLPGHGGSSSSADDIRIGTMSTAVSAAVAAETDEPVHLVGLSVGGLIAQTIAIERPAMVRTLTLIDTGARFSPEGIRAMRTRAATLRADGMPAILDQLFAHWFLPSTQQRRPELMDRLTKTLLHDDVAVQAALWEMIADYDSRDLLRLVRAPALVMVGEHDSSSPVAAAEELCMLLPVAQLVIVPDAAHLSPIERPDAIVAPLRVFLAENSKDVFA